MAAEWDTWSGAQWSGIDSALQQADASEITNAFGRNMSNMSDGRWLSARHTMRDPRNTLRGNTAPHSNLWTDRISEYAAASVPLHLADAWTYFGRALSAMSMGAAEVAQHLLYYAELRAAQSLLSRHGILILAGQKLVLTKATTLAIPIPGRAGNNEHQSLWIAFDGWSKLLTSSDFCGAVIAMNGSTIGEWISNRPVPASLRSVIAPLLQGWGLDLRRFSEDRNLRNHLSYDPTRLVISALGITPSLIGSLYEEVWSMLEPGGPNSFETLDRFIARQAFEAVQLNTGSTRRFLGSAAYRTFNSTWGDSVLGAGRGRFIADFLQHPTSPTDPSILRSAGVDTSSRTLSSQLTAMIGRALILLRLASGAFRELATSAGAGAATIDFWVQDMLAVHGIAAPAGIPPDYTEMYEDIGASLVEIAPLSALNAAGDLPELKRLFAVPLEVLSGFERVPAWLVG